MSGDMKEKNYRRISYEDRIRIEVLLRAKHTTEEIGELIGFHRTSITREINRGIYVHRNSDWTEEERYSPELAEERCQKYLREKGPDIKLGKDFKLAEYIEKKIGKDKYSPAAALAQIERENLKFSVSICRNTVYNYIDKDIFLTITNKDLPVKKNKKVSHHKVRRRKRAAHGEIIDNRPKEVDDRQQFGHWEMDTVVGQQGVSKKSLLVLTERKTRKEIVEPLKRHTTEEVVKAMDRIERAWGARFRDVFKTITVDNGTEFADCEGLERARRGKKKRTRLYYCHPFSSYERGSNENQNKLIRRHIPKGTNFDNRTKKEIKFIEAWINNYPREMFGFKTAEELFQKELNILNGKRGPEECSEKACC